MRSRGLEAETCRAIQTLDIIRATFEVALLQSRSTTRRKLSIIVLRSREKSYLTIGVCMKSVIARSLTSIQQSLSQWKGCQQEATGRVQRRASKDAPANTRLNKVCRDKNLTSHGRAQTEPRT
jgi:hypothetical protein